MKFSLLNPMKTHTQLLVLGLSLLATTSPLVGDVEQSVSQLIPNLAAEKVEDRYQHQMELQQLAAHASRPGAEAERLEMAKILAAKATDASVPQPARVWLVRQLEHIGAAEAVPALTKLLGDKDAELRECARRALEKNPSPGAGASLLAALQAGGEPAWKIGLINSLGERQDASAIGLLKTHLAEAATARVAAEALAKIAKPAAIEALWAANPSQADALIEAANRLLAQRDAPAARAIYSRIQSGKFPEATRAAAFAGLAKADPKSGAKLIQEALLGAEPRLQNMAVQLSAPVFGRNLTKAMLPLFPKMSPSVKAQVLGLLDDSAEKPVLNAAKDPEENVRVAALQALGRMGGAAGVPVLIVAAAGKARAEKTAAEAALVQTANASALAALAKQVEQGRPEWRVAAIRAMTARRQTSTLPALVKACADSNLAVSQAALAAVAQMGSDAELEPLARLALKGSSKETCAAVEDVAARVTDKAAGARKLLALTQSTETAKAADLMGAFSLLGGSEALAMVTANASGSDATLKEKAIRALGGWTDFSASQPLLKIIADSATAQNLKQLAIQGLVTLVKTSENEPLDSRASTVLAAWAAASRPDEQKSVLSAMAEVPHPKVVAVLTPLLKDEGLKNEAATAGLTLAQGLVAKDVAAAKALAQTIKDLNVSRDINRKADAVLRK